MATAKKKDNRPVWNGITFALGYNKNLEQFKKEFGDTHVFTSLPPDEREAAFVEAHQIATNGNLSATTTKSKDPIK